MYVGVDWKDHLFYVVVQDPFYFVHYVGSYLGLLINANFSIFNKITKKNKIGLYQNLASCK